MQSEYGLCQSLDLLYGIAGMTNVGTQHGKFTGNTDGRQIQSMPVHSITTAFQRSLFRADGLLRARRLWLFLLAAAIGRVGPVRVRRRLARQRRQRLGLLQVDAGALGDAAAVILVAVPEVPDHAQLDRLRALLQVAAEVGDQVVALPVLEGAVALAGLRVVVGRARWSGSGRDGPRPAGGSPCAGFGASLQAADQRWARS